MNWRGTLRGALAYGVAALAGFAIAYLVAAFLVFPSGGVIPDDGKVPAVTGLPYESAETELRRAGFQAEQGETRFHATAPKGTVLEQSPPGGSREQMGTTVTLAVSGGQATQPVPNVAGMTRDAAEEALETAGFDAGPIEYRPSDQPSGEVIETRPAAGANTTVPSTIVLVVSSGPNTASTPDVIGFPIDQDRQILEAAGLLVGDIAYEPTRGSSVVTAQSPAGGTEVPAGTRISLRVTGETPP